MEISITRFYNENLEIVNGFIERDEWIEYIKISPILKSDSPQQGKNPITGESINIGPQPDVGFICQGDERIHLQYNDGDIWLECDPNDETKSKLLKIANDLQAMMIDENQKVIDWKS